jgi:pyruvyl transferase EpsO
VTTASISQAEVRHGTNSEATDAIRAHAAFMSSLPLKHDLVADLIGGRRFHYVDIPVHGNIGDLLILHGTMAFFRKKNLMPGIVAPSYGYRPEWISDDEVVVFHGGGNFGDLYWNSGSQRLREQMVTLLPKNRIIVLPQTLHFSSPEQRHRSARIFRAHQDVHLCVRDERSRRMAMEFSGHVYLVPDMAHHLYPLEPQDHRAAAGTLLVSRTDGEEADSTAAWAQKSPKKIDWPELVGTRERHIDRFRRALRLLRRYGLGRPGSNILSSAWIAYSQSLIRDAIDLFASHEHIVTDRLHAHILACLMNKRSTVVDNSYGKNSGYVSAWTAGSELVTLRRQRGDSTS